MIFSVKSGRTVNKTKSASRQVNLTLVKYVWTPMTQYKYRSFERAPKVSIFFLALKSWTAVE